MLHPDSIIYLRRVAHAVDEAATALKRDDAESAGGKLGDAGRP